MSNPIVHVDPTYGEKDVTILTGQAYRFSGTNYSLDSIQAVIDLVKAKGSKENTVIFYDDNQIGVILDDSVMDRNQDKAVYDFAFSDDFREWKEILGVVMDQKKFVDFLKRRPVTEAHVTEPLLAQVQHLKLMTQIIGDYQHDDDGNTTFMFKTKDGEGKGKLPKKIELNMVILKESDLAQLIEFELELKKPKSEEEKPLFIITCPKLQRYIKIATDHEVGKLKKALEGYLILAGRMA